MPLELYAHPFSSYCQKVLIALYENDLSFELRMLAPGHDAEAAEFAELWPIRRMPLLRDGERAVMESTIIIEYLQIRRGGPVRLIPAEAEAALEARLLDRFFDNYVMTPMQRIVFDAIRPPENRDAQGVAEARALLDTAYAWLDARMAKREWAAGDFSLADCAAAPSLFYADWSHPIGDRFPRVRDYRARLLKRPSFARCVDEGRPYRDFFPLGAPDRD